MDSIANGAFSNGPVLSTNGMGPVVSANGTQPITTTYEIRPVVITNGAGSIAVANGAQLDAITNSGQPLVVANGNGSVVLANGTRPLTTVNRRRPSVISNRTAGNHTVSAAKIWVTTGSAVSEMVDALDGLPTEPPSIYMDLEGAPLSRYGTISILQIHVHPTKTIYLIDVQSLGEKCFSTPGKCLKTLRDILKSPLIPKVFFDVRSDSDALFALFNITLDGVLDLQLMEFATRSVLRKRFVRSLTSCVMNDSPLSSAKKSSWKSVKEQGRLLFTPKSGGSYEVLNERPLRQDILRYCAHDVSVMPVLWSVYDSKITQEWKQKVVVASRDRVWRSHEVDYMYISAGRDMAKAPLILTDPDPVVTG